LAAGKARTLPFATTSDIIYDFQCDPPRRCTTAPDDNDDVPRRDRLFLAASAASSIARTPGSICRFILTPTCKPTSPLSPQGRVFRFPISPTTYSKRTSRFFKPGNNQMRSNRRGMRGLTGLYICLSPKEQVLLQAMPCPGIAT
jgi:hypothetical protein